MSATIILKDSSNLTSNSLEIQTMLSVVGEMVSYITMAEKLH